MNNKGFTLIELLIVVAIISILAAIAVPNFLEAQTRSKVSKAHADLRTVATALEVYRLDTNRYPYRYLCFWERGPNGAPPPGSLPMYGTWEQNVSELSILTTPVTYLSEIPIDPFGHRLYSEDLPYDYFDFQAFQDSSNFVMADSVENAKWLTYSRGPNRWFDVMMEYDSTNGTISDGNISRFGNWTSGDQYSN